MRVEIDGQVFDVPDDATTDEIDALTQPAPAPQRGGAMDQAKAAINNSPELRVLRRAGEMALGAVLPTRGSPLGQAVSALTGGASDKFASPGIYGINEGKPRPERAPGESDRDHLRRSALAELEWANTPEAIGSMLPVVGLTMPGKPRTTQTAPPRVATTPEARTLIAAGVKPTAGQRAPQGSTVSLLEAVSSKNPLGMETARNATKEGFIRATQNKGVAPGAQAPANPNLQTRLGELLDGYEPAYDRVRNAPIAPEVVASLPDAAQMPRRGVDARTAQGVKAEVENALTVLGYERPSGGHGHGAAAQPPALVDPFGRPLPAAPKPPPTATAGDLLKVRENIRKQIRSTSPDDFDRLRLLEEAEGVVSEALEKSLSPEDAAHLRATDQQYARLMTSVQAAPAGQTSFTPLQYLRRVEKAAGRRNFKKGEAGDLQDLGEAAQVVLQDAPFTGGRAAVMSSVPGLHYLSAPLSRLANTEAGTRFLFEPRTKAVGGGPGTNQYAVALANAIRGRVGVQPYPVMADEEDRR